MSALTPSDSCTTICQGNPDFICGGYSAIDIYEIGEFEEPTVPSPTPEGSTYLGCYVDEPNEGRLLEAGPKDGDMSIEVWE